MKRVFSLLIIFLSIFICNKVYAYKSYKIGDVITYNGVDYYVIKYSKSDDDSLVLLKKEPLTVEEVKRYGVEHINKYTENSVGNVYSVSGYGGMAYYSSETCGYIRGELYESGCKTDYTSSDIKYVVDAWASDNIESNYLKEARILNLDDLTGGLGYSVDNKVSGSGDSLEVSSAVPLWLYNQLYSNWTSTSYVDSQYANYYISVDGRVYSNRVFSYNLIVRPVIVLSKSAFGEMPIIKGGKEFFIGDEVTYKGIKFYVIKDSNSEDKIVTLLKEYPLTVEEVDLYGGVGTDNNRVNINENFSNSYRYKASNNKGYGGMVRCTSTICQNQSDNSKPYENSDIKYVVDAWGLANLNKDDIKDLRLIKYEELAENLGYINEPFNGTVALPRNSFVPKWVYENCGYSYWTMSNREDSNTLWIVKNDGYLTNECNGGCLNEIRPVVELYKCVLDNSCDNNDIVDDIKENDNGIINSNKNESTTKVNVPNTLKSVSGLIILIGLVLICVGLNIFMIIKNRSSK